MKSRQVPFFLYWPVENVQFCINSIDHLGWFTLHAEPFLALHMLCTVFRLLSAQKSDKRGSARSVGWLSGISNFARFHKNVKSLELWKYISEITSPKGSFWHNKRQLEFSDLSSILHIFSQWLLNIGSRDFCIWFKFRFGSSPYSVWSSLWEFEGTLARVRHINTGISSVFN